MSEQCKSTPAKALRASPARSKKGGSDIETVAVGGVRVLARSSSSTETSVRYDCAVVVDELRQIAIVAEAKRSQGLPYEPTEIRRDFTGRRVLDFADDKDLEAAARGEKIASLAHGMIGRTMGLSIESVAQYAKRRRIHGRNQRKVIPRR